MKYLYFVFLLTFTAACNNDELERLRIENKELRKNASKSSENTGGDAAAAQKLAFLSGKMRGVKAVFKTNFGDITIELFPEKAPITVLNFISHAESGFYNGTTFHRVIENFMIQGGDPNSKDKDPGNDGQGGPKVAIPHEFNDVKHEPGVLSMARVSDVAAGAGSQFFIMHGTATHLDGQYTAFGKVISGMDIVNKIATLPKESGNDSRTTKPAIINSVDIQGL
jgi:peptidyl-prolyl cis-trans isomerase B (cyclophilin B)